MFLLFCLSPIQGIHLWRKMISLILTFWIIWVSSFGIRFSLWQWWVKWSWFNSWLALRVVLNCHNFHSGFLPYDLFKRTKQVQCNSLFSSPSLLTNEIDALCLRMCCFACCLFPRHFFARQIASVQPFTDLSNITLHLLSCRLLGIPSLARKRCLVLHLHGCCGWGTSHSVLSFLMLLRSLVYFYHFGIW